jgi:hemerythrin HHE cation binding domain-containing protein
MAEAPRRELDALELLMQDHREMESLFREFEHLQEHDEERARLLENACAEIRIHDRLESEIFYPAIREADAGEELGYLLDEAQDAHGKVRELVGKLEQLDANDERRYRHFALVSAHVKHHLLEEETQMFPLVRQLKTLDLESLATEMKERKSGLMAEMGLAEACEL